MKNIITLCIVCFIAIGTTYSQWDNKIQLSKNITTETIDVSEFDKIYATDDFIVNISFSESETSLKIEANQNLHGLIKIDNDNGRLKLRTKSYSSGNNGVRERLIAHVTVPTLVSITGSGDAVYKLLDPLKTQNLKLNLDDDAILKGDIQVDNLAINLDSDAELFLKGSAHEMSAKANSDSVIEGFDFAVHNIDIKLDGDSMAELTVNGKIDVTARGDSQFTYKGKGTISHKRISGDSEVSQVR